jgi:ATP-dependent Lon protease
MSATDQDIELLNSESSGSEPETQIAVIPVDPSAEPSKRLQIPELLPILPVRETVIFPGTIIPLAVGRDKSKKLIDSVITGNKILGVVAQRSSNTEDPGLEDLYRVGTVVSILKLLNLAEGQQSIIVHGLLRFGIERIVKSDPFLVARAHTREDTYASTTELDALKDTAKTQAARVIELTPGVPDDAVIVLKSIDRPSTLADFLAANLSLGLVEKQEILETFDVTDRLLKINHHLAHQIEVLELSGKIQQQVKSEIDKTQREYYLHEQLRAIQKELGETDGRDVELQEIKKALAEAKMPEVVEKEAKRELDRLQRTPQASP